MNSEIRHILVPVDFSGYSISSYRFALELADKCGAKITLLHVVEPPYNFATAVEGMLSMMEKNALSRMVQMKAEISGRKSNGADADIVVKHGRTAREILLQSKELSADLIIMGNKGQSGLQKMVLGSISSAIVEDSNIPVFVLPGKEPEVMFNLTKVVFATNLRERDPDNLLYAHSLSSYFNAVTEIVHVKTEDNFDSKLRIIGFRQMIKEMELVPQPEFKIIEHEHMLAGLGGYLSGQTDTMVVLNRYKRSMVQKLLGENHTEKVIRYSDFPILIIP